MRAGGPSRLRRPPRSRSGPTHPDSTSPARKTSELRALDVVAEHFAHGVTDLALGRVVARAVEDLLHEIRFARGPPRGGGERLERRGAGLVVACAPDLGDRALLLLLDLLADVEDRDVELLVRLHVLVDPDQHPLL